MTTPSGNENAFLGSLVGLAIGDALGLPVQGKAPTEIPPLETYLEVQESPDGEPAKGLISDRTEIALCLVESLTTNDGVLDPENINARIHFLTESATRTLMSDTVVQNIDVAFEHEGLVPEGTGTEFEASVAARGVIVGLLHSVGDPDPDALRSDATIAARLTHDDAESIAATHFVAQVTELASRYVDKDQDWEIPEIGFTGPVADELVSIANLAHRASAFEEVVLPVVRQGGDAATMGAIAGGIAGARFGAAGLPQFLIDDLDARIYLSMAAPWFYRTAMKKAGFAIDLRLIENEFPG